MAFRRMVLSTSIAFTVGAFAILGCSTEHRTMYLRFSTAVALPEVALAPGTYVFELADPLHDPTIVRVLSEDRSTIYFIGHTELARRPRIPRARAISFGETVSGRPVPIATWYPAGDAMGRRFIYRQSVVHGGKALNPVFQAARSHRVRLE